MYTKTKDDYKIATQDPNQPLRLCDLPKKLQDKYKNSILFEN